MSKHKEDHPALADWEVICHNGYGTIVAVAASWWHRDKRGGYTFRDDAGIAYDFPPGAVEFVRRAEPEPVRSPFAAREDARPVGGTGGASANPDLKVTVT